jgi:hypothetical protein
VPHVRRLLNNPADNDGAERDILMGGSGEVEAQVPHVRRLLDKAAHSGS